MASGVAYVRTNFYRGCLIDAPTGWLFNQKSGLLIFVVIDIPKPSASFFAIPPSKKNRKDQPLFHHK